MSLSAIQSRISAQVPALHGRVFVARDLDRAVEYALSAAGDVPSAVIFDFRVSAGANEIAVGAGVRQMLTEQFTVMTCVRYSGNSAKAIDAMDTTKDAVRAALVGWIGASADGYPVEYVGGGIAYSDVGLMIWGDEFRSHEHLMAG